jgi:hypothetical protein
VAKAILIGTLAGISTEAAKPTTINPLHVNVEKF